MNTVPSQSPSTTNERYFLNPARAKYAVTELLRGKIESLPSGARILELGCGDLQVLQSIRKIRPDLELHGVDSGEIVISDQTNAIHFTRSCIEEYRAEATFDLVLGIDVLEHMQRPDELVRCANSALIAGGNIYLSAPNVTKLFMFGDANFYSDYSHVRPFCIKSMKRLVEDFGFQVLEVRISGVRRGAILRWFYYLARGVITADVNYLNAAITCLGGNGVEVLAAKGDQKGMKES